MVKWIFATLVISLLVVLPLIQPRAQLSPVVVDGCAKLARVVHSEVAAAAAYGPGKSGPWVINIGQGDISVCTHTAKTVSHAFTSAMLSAGLDVSWHRGSRPANSRPVDFCLNAFLAQCYPLRKSNANLTSGADASYVHKSWAIVSQAVMQAMYNPISSDEVRFRDNDLRLRIGLALRSIGLSDDH